MSTDEIIKEITKALGLIYQISGAGVRNDPKKPDWQLAKEAENILESLLIELNKEK